MNGKLSQLKREGMAVTADLQGRLPDSDAKKKGPYAVIECFQEIPCNPCVISCPVDAIQPFEDINDLPYVDFSACTGCAACARVCPGLAIFIVDESLEGDMGTVMLPYEYLPLPEKGDLVLARGRDGRDLFPAKVNRVMKGGKSKTPLVTLEVPKEYLQQVRSFSVIKDESPGICSGETAYPEKESSIVCRCEGVDLDEIRDLIARGYKTLDEIKHRSRAGMGPCQGRSCRQVILNELARDAGVSVDQLPSGSFRPPTVPVSMDVLAKESDQDA
ncbi:MAG: 4Fe-4S binding protein [Fastidiosipila sp.]|nr:4Fe-4S binding protein [Fastidiosipila sp.]